MNVREFEEALRKGLGRAYLYVQSQSETMPKDMEEVLLRSCVENFSFDAQCEGDRSAWIYEILKLTENLPIYENHILKHFEINDVKDDDSWEVNHRLCLLTHFAKAGSERSRLAIYTFLEECHLGASWVGGNQVIELDGLDGFIKVAKRIGYRLDTEKDFWEDGSQIYHAVELLGESPVLERLENEAKTCKYVRKYKNETLPDYIKNYQRKSESKIKKSRTSPAKRRQNFGFTTDQVIEKAQRAEEEHLGFYMRFGNVATDEELEQVIDKMKSEQGVDQLIRYAWIFRTTYRKKNKHIPERLLTRLLELLEPDKDGKINEKLAAAISYSLSHVNDERIRKITKEHFLDSAELYYSLPFEMMKKSVKQEDTELIFDYFSCLIADQSNDDIHSVILDAVNLTENLEIDQYLQPVLTTCYTLSPCSICRESAYKQLKQSNLIPEEIKLEYKYDLNSFPEE